MFHGKVAFELAVTGKSEVLSGTYSQGSTSFINTLMSNKQGAWQEFFIGSICGCVVTEPLLLF
jgi:hypothetical protein